MSLKCPRCHAMMDSHDAPLPDGGGVTIDRCNASSGGGCGTWYDAAEIGAANPRFGDRLVRDALRHARHLAPAGHEAPKDCPRCAPGGAAATLAPAAFVGVTLDVCEKCGGLWIDRAEYPALMSALTLYDPAQGQAVAAHYRSAHVGQSMARSAVYAVHCERCKVAAPLDQTTLTDLGVFCVPCGLEFESHERAGGAAEDFDGERSLWASIRGVLGAARAALGRAAEAARGARAGGDPDGLLYELTVWATADGGVVNVPVEGVEPTTLPIANEYTGADGGYVAVYTRDDAAGPTHAVGGGIRVAGFIRVQGEYDGEIFHPRGWRGRDISAAREFKDLCRRHFPALGDAWAGGDTGGFFGA